MLLIVGEIIAVTTVLLLVYGLGYTYGLQRGLDSDVGLTEYNESKGHVRVRPVPGKDAPYDWSDDE